MTKIFSAKRVLVVFLAAIIILLIFLRVSGKKNFDNLFSFVLGPFQKFFSFLGQKFKSFFDLLAAIKNLRGENLELKKQNNELLSENTRLKELKRENEILRKELGLEEKEEWKIISTRIIRRDPENIRRVVIIDKGEKSGVKIDQPVITPDGFVVGKITETKNSEAQVTFLTDNNSTVSAQTQETQALGIAQGKHGLGIELHSIPPDTVINPGDTVITSGQNSIFPPGLLIGQIEGITSAPNELFQSASVKPSVDWNKLEFVFVLTQF